MLDCISQELIELFEVRGVMVVLFDEQQQQLHLVAANDRLPSAPNLLDMAIPIGLVPGCAQLIVERAAMLVNAAQADQLLGPLAHYFHTAGLTCVLAVPLLANSAVIGALVITSDPSTPPVDLLDRQLLETLSGQVAAAIEHVRLFEIAEQARDRAEAANRAKSQFLATMSHEIRTPLNAVLGYTQLLQRDPTMRPDQLDQLGMIERAGQHLLMLLSDILDLARIEADKLVLEEQAAALPALLQETVDVFATLARQKGLALSLELGDGMPEAVRVDARRLRQVLINLLGNAVKYTDAGSVLCTVRRCTPEGLGDGQVRLRFSIHDTGIGIDAVELPLITMPFHQVGDVSRRNGGTGLGLAICLELLHKMRSGLHVHSEVGRGSTFWFDLDLALADAPVSYA
jgi:signal transduction histidine kinase